MREATSERERARHFDHVEQIVLQLDRDVDFLAWELRPPVLDGIPFVAVVKEFLEQWSRITGVRVDFHHSPADPARLPGDVPANLYRIVQEGLNNVAKHARAKHVSVIFERRADELTLIIEDDGDGFDPDDRRVPTQGHGSRRHQGAEHRDRRQTRGGIVARQGDNSVRAHPDRAPSQGEDPS